MGHDRSELDERQIASPQTETEHTLAGLWQDVLQVERVGRDDGFLPLGGDSLYAAELASRVQDELSVEVSLRDILSATLRGLAARIDELRTGSRAASREDVSL